jgi:hypothetical protein
VTKPSHLVVDSLPAVLALNSLLDNRIARNPTIQVGNRIQRKTDANEVKTLVEKGSVAAVRTSKLRCPT